MTIGFGELLFAINLGIILAIPLFGDNPRDVARFVRRRRGK